MPFSNTSMADRQILVNVLRPRPWVCMTLLLIHAASGFSQETDFSPFARFGLGTAQGNLTPAIASIGGITSVSTSNSLVNADQPAAAASMLNPTFQTFNPNITMFNPNMKMFNQTHY